MVTNIVVIHWSLLWLAESHKFRSLIGIYMAKTNAPQTWIHTQPFSGLGVWMGGGGMSTQGDEGSKWTPWFNLSLPNEIIDHQGLLEKRKCHTNSKLTFCNPVSRQKLGILQIKLKTQNKCSIMLVMLKRQRNLIICVRSKRRRGTTKQSILVISVLGPFHVFSPYSGRHPRRAWKLSVNATKVLSGNMYLVWSFCETTKKSF